MISPSLFSWDNRCASAAALGLSIAALTGCVTGPFASYETARTVGQGSDEIIGGFGTSGYSFKWNHGLTNRFDIGVQLEQLSVGLRGKYALIQASQGFAFTAALGLGASGYGSHYYGDLLLSDLIGQFEPYSTLRLTHVNVDKLQFRDKNNGTVIARIDAGQFDYGQVIVGTRYWINSNWSLAGELSVLLALGAVHIDDTVLGSAAFAYRF